MLHVVAQSFKPVKLLSQCWIRLRALHKVNKVLWVVSFPRCTAGPNIVGSYCIRLHTTANMDAITPNIVGSTMLGVVAIVFTCFLEKKLREAQTLNVYNLSYIDL